MIFPEGTRYSIKRKDVLEKSQKFAVDNDLSPLKHVSNSSARLGYRHGKGSGGGWYISGISPWQLIQKYFLIDFMILDQ